MFDQEIEYINDQSQFYQSFRRTSFFERLAHWSRLFCYSFLVFHLFSIILNMLIPFAISAPDLFFQMLFLLLLWGAIEVVGIPLEAIKDTCTIDYQKNWICLEQNRFFFNRVKVLASFNYIKAIGVSSRPGPINNALFAASDKRYAIFVLGLDNQMFAISDYTLSLDEANEIVQNIHARHLSGAQIVTGMPGYEIELDSQMGVLTTRPAIRSVSSCFFGIVNPIFQAMIAFTGSSIVITAMTIILASVALSFFNSDIQVARQPVVQLFALPMDNVEEILPPPQTPPPEIVVTEQSPEIPSQRDETVTSQPPLTIDLFQQKVVSTGNSQEPQNQSEAEKTLDPVIFPEVAIKTPIPEDPLYPASKREEEPEKTGNEGSATLQDASPAVSSPEKQKEINPVIVYDSTKKLLTPEPSQEPEFKPISAPLKSRIPGENNLMLASINRISSKAESEPELPKSTAPSTDSSNAVFEPGRGLKNLLFIGQNAVDIERIIGKPLMIDSIGNRRHIFYKGFTVCTATGNYGAVQSITITSTSHAKLGTLTTTNDIKVGSSISDIVAQLGPAETFAENPGLHFVGRGISFFPAINDASRIGSIKIYQPGNHAD